MFLSWLWLCITSVIALLQVLVLTQPEWVVNQYHIQGLFAMCTPWECTLRPLQSMLPLLCHLIGSVLFLLTALALLPTVCCTIRHRPVQVIANLQIVASIFMGICLFMVPFDMEDVNCTLGQLMKSPNCRIGWAYAVSAVCCMISICCPVLGNLTADDRKRYALLTSNEHFL